MLSLNTNQLTSLRQKLINIRKYYNESASMILESPSLVSLFVKSLYLIRPETINFLERHHPFL